MIMSEINIPLVYENFITQVLPIFALSVIGIIVVCLFYRRITHGSFFGRVEDKQ